MDLYCEAVSSHQQKITRYMNELHVLIFTCIFGQRIQICGLHKRWFLDLQILFWRTIYPMYVSSANKSILCEVGSSLWIIVSPLLSIKLRKTLLTTYIVQSQTQNSKDSHMHFFLSYWQVRPRLHLKLGHLFFSTK